MVAHIGTGHKGLYTKVPGRHCIDERADDHTQHHSNPEINLRTGPGHEIVERVTGGSDKGNRLDHNRLEVIVADHTCYVPGSDYQQADHRASKQVIVTGAKITIF